MTVSSTGVSGVVMLQTYSKTQTKFECKIKGLEPGYHGMHIHACGDLRKGCQSGCAHYNPTNSKHGGPKGDQRHKGDLGNILADSTGYSSSVIIADVTIDEILGRMLVIHAGEDDLGKQSSKESKETGNSGPRIACGIVGRLSG